MDDKNKERTGSEKPAKTILLVDDEAVSREKIGTILGRQGYAVIDRSDALSALAVVSQGTPAVDLVITDYRMPDMDGIEFARELKRKIPDTPLIMITGHTDIESYLKALNIGVFEYLNKPIIAHELVRIVSLALKQRNEERDPD